MIISVQFQICSLILVSMILLLFFSKKKLNMFINKVYSSFLIVVFTCVLLDVVSAVAICLQNQIPSGLCDFLCKLYVFSVMVVGCFILFYVLAEINNNNQIPWVHYFIYSSFTLVAVVTFSSLPIYIYYKGRVLYTYGPYVQLAFTIGSIYLGISLFYIIKYYKTMNVQRRTAVIFSVVGLSLTALIQYFNRELLLLSFSMAVGVVYIYISLQNPDENLDKETGTLNRNAFYAKVSGLYEEGREFFVLSVSLDNYKFITETFGIKGTKQLMKHVKNYLSESRHGILFRNGEVEYSIIFEGNREEFLHVASEIRDRFRNSWKIGGVEVMLNVSISAIPSKEVSNQPEELLELVKYFIYETRKRGEGSLVIVDKKEIAKKAEKESIERALKRAIEREEIQVYYQPIYCNKSGYYTCAEALVRIRDEENRFIPPEVFIPIAEQNGWILRLGSIVFEKVCKFIKEHRLQERGIHYIEVNLSVIQCMQDNLAEKFLEIMRAYDISPGFINLEITETAASNSENVLIHNMKQLMQQGTTFSLDDYGSGYANLNYITFLPFHLVKLDKEIVWAYFRNPRAKVVLESAITMIKHLGMKIVAEGVESMEQYATMQKLGVDYIQGFYFSKPVDEMSFLKIFEMESLE